MTMPTNNRKFDNLEFEKIDTTDFINAQIVDIQIEKEHEFKFKEQTTIGEAIRFKFDLEGYQYPKYSNWMKFNYSDKSQLYKKYLTPLVSGSEPYMEFDIEKLKDMKVKVMFVEREYKDKIYYNIETIRPIKDKITRDEVPF